MTATARRPGVTDAAIHAGLAAQRGEIDQVPSAVSAIKINGQRAYKRVRDGESRRAPAPPGHGLPARRAGHPAGRARRPTVIDVDVDVTCSSGTYIRAIARDLGARARGRRPPDRAAAYRGRRDDAGRGGDPDGAGGARAGRGRPADGRGGPADVPAADGHRRARPGCSATAARSTRSASTGPYAVFDPAGELLAIVSRTRRPGPRRDRPGPGLSRRRSGRSGAAATVATRSAAAYGLSRKPSQPASIAAARSCGSTLAVTATTAGLLRPAGMPPAASSRARVSPLPSGRFMSSRIRSTSAAASCSRAEARWTRRAPRPRGRRRRRPGPAPP